MPFEALHNPELRKIPLRIAREKRALAAVSEQEIGAFMRDHLNWYALIQLKNDKRLWGWVIGRLLILKEEEVEDVIKRLTLPSESSVSDQLEWLDAIVMIYESPQLPDTACILEGFQKSKDFRERIKFVLNGYEFNVQIYFHYTRCERFFRAFQLKEVNYLKLWSAAWQKARPHPNPPRSLRPKIRTPKVKALSVEEFHDRPWVSLEKFVEYKSSENSSSNSKKAITYWDFTLQLCDTFPSHLDYFLEHQNTFNYTTAIIRKIGAILDKHYDPTTYIRLEKLALIRDFSQRYCDVFFNRTPTTGFFSLLMNLARVEKDESVSDGCSGHLFPYLVNGDHDQALLLEEVSCPLLVSLLYLLYHPMEDDTADLRRTVEARFWAQYAYLEEWQDRADLLGWYWLCLPTDNRVKTFLKAISSRELQDYDILSGVSRYLSDLKSKHGSDIERDKKDGVQHLAEFMLASFDDAIFDPTLMQDPVCQEDVLTEGGINRFLRLLMKSPVEERKPVLHDTLSRLDVNQRYDYLDCALTVIEDRQGIGSQYELARFKSIKALMGAYLKWCFTELSCRADWTEQAFEAFLSLYKTQFDLDAKTVEFYKSHCEQASDPKGQAEALMECTAEANPYSQLSNKHMVKLLLTCQVRMSPEGILSNAQSQTPLVELSDEQARAARMLARQQAVSSLEFLSRLDFSEPDVQVLWTSVFCSLCGVPEAEMKAPIPDDIVIPPQAIQSFLQYYSRLKSEKPGRIGQGLEIVLERYKARPHQSSPAAAKAMARQAEFDGKGDTNLSCS